MYPACRTFLAVQGLWVSWAVWASSDRQAWLEWPGSQEPLDRWLESQAWPDRSAESEFPAEREFPASSVSRAFPRRRSW